MGEVRAIASLKGELGSRRAVRQSGHFTGR